MWQRNVGIVILAESRSAYGWFHVKRYRRFDSAAFAKGVLLRFFVDVISRGGEESAVGGGAISSL